MSRIIVEDVRRGGDVDDASLQRSARLERRLALAARALERGLRAVLGVVHELRILEQRVGQLEEALRRGAGARRKDLQ